MLWASNSFELLANISAFIDYTNGGVLLYYYDQIQFYCVLFLVKECSVWEDDYFVDCFGIKICICIGFYT